MPYVLRVSVCGLLAALRMRDVRFIVPAARARRAFLTTLAAYYTTVPLRFALQHRRVHIWTNTAVVKRRSGKPRAFARGSIYSQFAHFHALLQRQHTYAVRARTFCAQHCQRVCHAHSRTCQRARSFAAAYKTRTKRKEEKLSAITSSYQSYAHISSSRMRSLYALGKVNRILYIISSLLYGACYMRYKSISITCQQQLAASKNKNSLYLFSKKLLFYLPSPSIVAASMAWQQCGRAGALTPTTSLACLPGITAAYGMASSSMAFSSTNLPPPHHGLCVCL